MTPWHWLALAVGAIIAAAWTMLDYRSQRVERERAAIVERTKKPRMVRCGGRDTGNPFFCGEKVPEWFADIVDDGPPMCGRCVSGGQIRYPKRGETEDEYNAYVKAAGEEHGAVADEYTKLVQEFSSDKQEAPRIAPIADDGRLRIQQEDALNAETEQAAEEEAGKKPGRGA